MKNSVSLALVLPHRWLLEMLNPDHDAMDVEGGNPKDVERDNLSAFEGDDTMAVQGDDPFDVECGRTPQRSKFDQPGPPQNRDPGRFYAAPARLRQKQSTMGRNGQKRAAEGAQRGAVHTHHASHPLGDSAFM